MADALRLIEQNDGSKEVRVPSSLAWMVEAGIAAALDRVAKAQADGPGFMADDVPGETVVTVKRQ